MVTRDLIIGGGGVPSNPEQEYRSVLNREKSKAARPLVKPFLDHLKLIMSAIHDQTPELIQQHRWSRNGAVNPTAWHLERILEGDFESATSWAIGQWRHGRDRDAVVKTARRALIKELYKLKGCYEDVPVELGTSIYRKT